MDFGHSQAVATEAGQGPVPPLPTPLRPKSAQSRVMRPLREFAALPAQLRTSVRSCAGALRCSRSGFHLCDYLSAMCSRAVCRGSQPRPQVREFEEVVACEVSILQA